MIIGFDGKRAVQNNTGLGNYSRLLVEKMATIFPDNSYLLYAPHQRQNPRLTPIEALGNVAFRYPQSSAAKLFPSIWRSVGITSDLQADGVSLFHGLSGELPLNIHKASMASVVTIHDLIFKHFPQNYKAIDRRIYDYKFRRACIDASRIIAISEKTKADIVVDYHINPDKIDVVYQGCDTRFAVRPDEITIAHTLQKYAITNPYIISVGTLEPRKNQEQAVKGLAALPTDIHLVLVGQRGEYAREVLDSLIKNYKLTDRVKFLEGISFDDLPALYAGALLSSYTSRYEGFGLPVTESLSVGTPVIVATGSCLEEAGGPNTPSISSENIEQWAETARMLIDNDSLRREIATKGRAYVQRFSHDAMARGTMETYRKALQDFTS